MLTLCDCRCRSCNALLAKLTADGFTFRRGDFQVAVTGKDLAVALTCYRCQTLNQMRASNNSLISRPVR